MADASSGVSGSDSSQNAQNAADRAAETAAAQQAAADKAATEAAAAAALNSVQAAPVDLSISPAAISQLSAMTVDTVPSLSSLQTLGGVPTAATYADIAQATATPTTPAVTEYNAWSASFSITPNDPATVETAPLSAVSINVGLNHVGDINANLEARMGIAPAQVTFAGAVSYTNGVTTYGLSGVAGPFGGIADPNYGITATTATELDFGKLGLSLNVNANTDGFTNGSFNANYSTPLSENWTGSAAISVSADRNGPTAVDGTIGAHYNSGGASLGVTGSGRVDTRTGDVSGGAKFNLGIKF